MNSTTHAFYRHSGKFAPHGPLLALFAVMAIGFPAGYIYAYLIKWIPLIYLNALITFGYGAGFGFLTGRLMKFGKVRNGPIALLCGLIAGILAWYFNWNGYVHSLVKDGPWVFTPTQIGRAMKILYDEGSWGLLHSNEPLTGIPLAIVWLAEAGIIVGLSTFISYGTISDLPYCENHECWLDEKKKIDKMDAFTNPAHLAAFQSGDLSPLEQAAPRVPASGQFARLTLKHSSKCEEFCTVTISNVTVTVNKDGKEQEKEHALVSNLMVPKTMLDYLGQFDHISARRTVGV